MRVSGSRRRCRPRSDGLADPSRCPLRASCVPYSARGQANACHPYRRLARSVTLSSPRKCFAAVRPTSSGSAGRSWQTRLSAQGARGGQGRRAAVHSLQRVPRPGARAESPRALRGQLPLRARELDPTGRTGRDAPAGRRRGRRSRRARSGCRRRRGRAQRDALRTRRARRQPRLDRAVRLQGRSAAIPRLPRPARTQTYDKELPNRPSSRSWAPTSSSSRPARSRARVKPAALRRRSTCGQPCATRMRPASTSWSRAGQFAAEVAWFLAERGRLVTIATRDDVLAAGASDRTRRSHCSRSWRSSVSIAGSDVPAWKPAPAWLADASAMGSTSSRNATRS